MPSHSEEPGIWLSVWRFLLTHCLYERAAKVLARLRGCAGSPEPSLLAQAISTKFAWRGPYCKFTVFAYTRSRPVLVKNMIILAANVNKWTFIEEKCTLLERLPQRRRCLPNPNSCLRDAVISHATSSKNRFLKRISCDQLYQFWSSCLLLVQIKIS